MAKRNIRILAVILVLAMTAALLPVTAAAAETTDTWNVSKSKTAAPTVLSGSNTTTKITLSLPSAEYTNTLDLVFAIDKSNSGDQAGFAGAAIDLLNELTEVENLKVKVGVVFGDALARDAVQVTSNGKYSGLVDISNETGLNAVKTAINTKLDGTITGYLGGSNTQGLVVKANEMLQGTKAGDDKQIVLLSDFMVYCYNGEVTYNGKTYQVPCSKSFGSGSYLDQIDNRTTDTTGYMGGSPRTNAKYTSWDALWTAYENGTLQKDQGWSIDTLSRATAISLVSGLTDEEFSNLIGSNGAWNAAVDPNKHTVSGPEKAMVLTNQALTDALSNNVSLTVITNLESAFSYAQSADNTNLYHWPYVYACGMLDALAQNQNVKIYQTSKTATSADMQNILTEVKNRTIYVLAQGKVTDIIGSKFDLVTGNAPFTVTVDGVTQSVTRKDNTWYFGKATENVYPYELKYEPDSQDGEKLTWIINVPVERDKRVELSYNVQLNDTSRTATYPTNVSAILNYSSTGDLDNIKSDTFEVPTVSYTVGGYNHYDDQTIPDTVPTGLNGIDHIAYIIGRQGYARPNATITRAEVAAIFFRLLTDEMRESHLTSTNDFTDVKAGSWYNTAVSTLVDMGILKGYPDGTFRPDASITRAEFAAIAARFDSTDITGKTATFTDIATSWAKADIERTAILGWVEGYPDGSFRPDSSITRAEAVTLVNRVLQRVPGKTEDLLDDMVKWPDNADTTAWYYLAIQEASNSHDYEKYAAADKTTEYEKWTKLTTNPDWVKYQK